jgi:hypothetical protein
MTTTDKRRKMAHFFAGTIGKKQRKGKLIGFLRVLWAASFRAQQSEARTLEQNTPFTF